MHLTLTQVCEAVISATQIRYLNRVIEMENSRKFRVGKVYYNSLNEAKKGIEDSYQSLAKSIIKP